jgi:hypothetical protein
MWADVRGYEGRYQVSTLGQVKSLARMRKGKSNCEVPVPERMMALRVKSDNGRQRPYVEVCLRDGGPRDSRGKQKLVHRLVADAFIKPLEHGEQRVMKTIEHARLHPTVVSPLDRNSATGQFLPRNV